jgi:Ser/Thr protein kinase RdoA (MazF antagonist)
MRLGPAERAGEAWQRKAHFALLRVAPRHLHEGIAVLGKQVYLYSISEWLDGRRFDYRRDLRRLAATLASLHRRTRDQRIAPADAGDIEGYLRGQLSQYVGRRVGGSGIQDLLRRSAAIELAALAQGHDADRSFRCLVHNDLVRQNIIIVADRARLIDWDWAMNAHPALDICGFLSPFVTSWDKEFALSDRAISIFLNRYLGAFNRNDARTISRGLTYAWRAYNAMVANWLYSNSTISRPHLRESGFYRRVFARSQAIYARLRESTAD